MMKLRLSMIGLVGLVLAGCTTSSHHLVIKELKTLMEAADLHGCSAGRVSSPGLGDIRIAITRGDTPEKALRYCFTLE